MARMYKSDIQIDKCVKLSTICADHEIVHNFKVDDIIENLRYIADGEIQIVSGRVAAINYEVSTPLKLSVSNPSDTLPQDMKLTNLVLDTSEKFNASSVVIPLREIVEFEDEKDEDILMMRFSPYFIVNMTLHYSNYKVQEASLEVGDTFDKVRILNPNDVGNDITGKFEVVSFYYTVESNRTISVKGVVFRKVDTGEIYVIDFKNILALNEVFNHEVNEPAAIAEVIANLSEGDTVIISNPVDTTGAPLAITTKNVTVDMAEDIVADGGNNSGIKVSGEGSVTISGTGKVVNITPYGAGHGSGVISATENSSITFNGGGVEAVIIDDPVNKGQFGVTVYDNAKLTVNDGEFTTGWYCISGNGSKTTADAVTEINGGTFVSVADYAIYHPHAGKLIINGGNISGAAGALAANNGVIEINGGTLTATGGGDTGNSSDGTGGLGNAALNLNAKYGDITCRITGGTFIATAEDTILVAVGSAHNVDIQITGGKFTSKPNENWIPEGYLCTGEADADGFYKVYKALT